MAVSVLSQPTGRWQLPLLALLRPINPAGVGWALVVGIALGATAITLLGWPLWMATTTVLLALLVPGVQQWRAQRRQFGTVAMMLSVLLFMQGFHTVEHLVQLVQYHWLGWSARSSTGLLSAANAEWIHFVWNWFVVCAVSSLVLGGVRNRWIWLLLAWSLLHSLEHTYMFVRYLAVLDELRQLGVTTVTAQGLPGILGRDGWVATSPLTQSLFICRAPGLTTASRIDVHFWWNAGESILLLFAGNAYCARQLVARQ